MYTEHAKAVSLLGEALGFLSLCKKCIILADDELNGEDAYYKELMDIVGDIYHIQYHLKHFLDSDWSVLHKVLKEVD